MWLYSPQLKKRGTIMQIQSRLSYFLLPLVIQTTLVHLLNSFNTIQWCALVFSIFTLHMLYVAEKKSLKTALGVHALSLFINLMINMHKLYFIHGKPISGLFVASYLSVFVSISVGLFFFTKYRPHYLLSAIITSIVDGLAMMLFFVHVYAPTQVLQIFIKEVSFKAGYSALILATIYGVRASMMKAHTMTRD
jgi:hypothetical protein